MRCAAQAQRCSQSPFAGRGASRPRSRGFRTSAIGADASGGGKAVVGGLSLSPGVALDPRTHLLAALCSPEAGAAACVVRYLQALTRAGQPAPAAGKGWWWAGGNGSGRSASVGSMVWLAVSTSMYFTRLNAASEHGFTSLQQRQVAADVLGQLEACLAAYEVSPVACHRRRCCAEPET